MLKTLICAGIMTVAAYAIADDQTIIKEIHCPTPGVEVEPYKELYQRIDSNYIKLYDALDHFLSVYSANFGSINGAVNTAYEALGFAAREVAGCDDPADFEDFDCTYDIVISLADGTVVFSLEEGSDNTASNFKYDEIDSNYNTFPSFMEAQTNFCGNQWESTYSNEAARFENLVAQRLGDRFRSLGTVGLIERLLVR